VKASPVVTYSIGRLFVFLVVAAVLALLGLRSWLLVLAALLVSMPLSYVVLRGQRAAFARQLERRARERRELRAKLQGDEPRE
jgi:ABC-type spermidine/putrescine transport system permease subunit II